MIWFHALHDLRRHTSYLLWRRHVSACFPPVPNSSPVYGIIYWATTRWGPCRSAGQSSLTQMHGALEPAGLAMINSTIRRTARTAGRCQRAVG
eukprot:scaffold67983_cov77-Phaeocystis_antarctica.AAC.2